MKATHFSISIPEPCIEGWEHMTPCEKGRFCESCQKTVIDFTGYSDAELAAFFSRQENANTCGRFYADQIENKVFSYTAPVKKPYRTLAMAASVAALTVMSFAAEAQDVKKDLSPVTPVITTTNAPGIESDPDSVVIEGVVKDNKGEPLLVASIQVYSKDKLLAGSTTDIDGNYRFVVPRNRIQANSVQIICRFLESKDSISVVLDQTSLNPVHADFTLKVPSHSFKDNEPRVIRMGGLQRSPPLIDRNNPGSSTTLPSRSIEKMPR